MAHVPPSATDTPRGSRAPGSRLGPYELRRRLGRGGSGEVWEAVLHGPAGFAKPVALKMLLGGRHTVHDRRMLLREARLGGRIQHPHVVSTLLVGEHDGVLCVALELVRGLPLGALLEGSGPLSGNALVEVGTQLAAALHHVHTFRVDGRDAGLVHRDVKPGNVLVDRYGMVKLADLGISLLRGASGEIAGTPGYAPPEQFDGTFSPASDLFALGVTLYQLATRRRPFGGGRAALVAVQRVEERLAEPGFLGALDRQLPGLGEVVGACLRFEPAQRPRSAEAVRGAMAALRATATGPSLVAMLGQVAPDLVVSELGTAASEAATRVLPPGNLPPSRDRFFGRSEELRQLAEATATASWVVLLGPGGHGKTRLALEHAQRQQHALQGGAWAFELAEARSVAGICAAVSGGLGVPLGAGDPAEQLGRAFAARGRCLVVLDNLEQCLDALPATVGRWRQLAPEATFLGTSRVRPTLSAEAEVSIGGLSRDDAVALFVARAPRPVADDERERVADLCDAIDRVPLAIELAAARTRMLSVPVLQKRLGLALLGGARDDRPERHRSVTASIRWSWELLSEPAAAALLQLSVFEGTFDLSAAEAVLSLGDDAPWALDVLEELADASQLRVDPASGRFGTWMAVRSFGAAMLPYPERRAAEERHGRHYAGLELGYRPELVAELDNVVAACRRAIARSDGAVAAATLDLASEVLDRRGPHDAWAQLADDVASIPLSGTARAVVARRRAYARWRGLGAEAVDDLRAAVAVAEQEALPVERARCLARLARALAELGDPTAEDHYQRALALQQAHGNRRDEAQTLTSYGVLLNDAGRIAESEATYHRAVQLHRATGNRLYEGISQSNLGVLLLAQQRLDEAEALFVQARRIHELLDDPLSVAVALANLGVVHRRRGEPQTAQAFYERALATYRTVGEQRLQSITLANLGTLAFNRGDLQEASERFAAAHEMATSCGSAVTAAWALARLGEVDLKDGRLERAVTRLEEAAGVFRDVGRPANLAESLGVLVRAYMDRGERTRARQTLDEALAVAPPEFPIDSLAAAQALFEDPR